MARDGKVSVQLYSTCFLISVSLLNAFPKKRSYLSWGKTVLNWRKY